MSLSVDSSWVVMPTPGYCINDYIMNLDDLTDLTAMCILSLISSVSIQSAALRAESTRTHRKCIHHLWSGRYAWWYLAGSRGRSVLGHLLCSMDAVTLIKYHKALIRIEFLFRDARQYTGWRIAGRLKSKRFMHNRRTHHRLRLICWRLKSEGWSKN